LIIHWCCKDQRVGFINGGLELELGKVGITVGCQGEVWKKTERVENSQMNDEFT
jgi:hypothetical protein